MHGANPFTFFDGMVQDHFICAC